MPTATIERSAWAAGSQGVEQTVEQLHLLTIAPQVQGA
jgi:hypothetical protein